MMFFIFWCIFSFTWNVRMAWSCWTTMVMLLVFIYVMCIYDCWWIFLTCYWCWIVGVTMYWNMMVWIVEVVWIYALLLSIHRFTHCWCRILYPCWWRILCIQLFGVIMMFSWHQGRRPRRWFGTTRVKSQCRHIACLGWVVIVYVLDVNYLLVQLCAWWFSCNWWILYLCKYCWW